MHAIADALIADGRLVEAIDVLTAENRARRDPAIEERLVRLRLEAFATLDRSAAPAKDRRPARRRARRPARRRAADDVLGPELTPDSLTATSLGDSIQHHGYALVRGFLAEPAISRLVDDIEEAFTAFDDAEDPQAGGSPPCFVPFVPGAGEVLLGEAWDPLIPRVWTRDGGALYAADFPAALFDVMEAFHDIGLPGLLTGHLGERPAVSVKKTALRRTTPDMDAEWWHQDGAFLGDDVHAINVWVALSDCGRDAPGIDLVDRRLERIVETGTGDARFDWSASSQAVTAAAEGASITRPEFRAGDALLFDQFLLHKTAIAPTMSKVRYAVETWFFGLSKFPIDQIPLVI
jgi:hypothetical protein